ncbi:hypothetical protein Tco_1130943 [Tanacetum coccineum]
MINVLRLGTRAHVSGNDDITCLASNVWELLMAWKERNTDIRNCVSFVLGFKRLQGFLAVTTAQITVLFIILLDNLRNRSRIGINKWYQSFALRNFDLEDMEFESTNSGTTAKLPILKLGEYEMWVIRIKQYFQIQDYALWEVIENGDSWVSVPQTNRRMVHLVTKMSIPVIAEEKDKIRKNDVKASYKENSDDILKHIIENFSCIKILKLKILRSLPPEWNTHVVVWMNKADIETMSIDDLYNNFKIIEQDVKKSVGASSGAQNLAFMTAPSTSSTNDVNTANPAYEVSTVSPNINTACPQQYLEQIHEDDLEAMDLKWQLSLLSMRAKRYFQRTGKKIFINANDTAGYQDNTRKQGNNKDTSSKAMLAIDVVGFDLTDMAEEQVQADMALMAFSDSELNQTEFTAAIYKRGLATVEEQLVTYRKNEVVTPPNWVAAE